MRLGKKSWDLCKLNLSFLSECHPAHTHSAGLSVLWIGDGRHLRSVVKKKGSVDIAGAGVEWRDADVWIWLASWFSYCCCLKLEIPSFFFYVFRAILLIDWWSYGKYLIPREALQPAIHHGWMVARVYSTWLGAQDGCVSCFRFGGPGGFETWMSDGMVREADSQAGTLCPTWNHPLISFAINVGNVCGADVWIMTARSTRHCQTPFGSFGTWPGFKRLSPPFEQRKSKALQVCKHRVHFKPCKPKGRSEPNISEH